mmetsp:Transcript_8640/g.32520  ORF Transcript_8640/g.32520 Transcript_8640/m.32520 type:complete len:799 (+) Transcript_8640:1597-3993(+)
MDLHTMQGRAGLGLAGLAGLRIEGVALLGDEQLSVFLRQALSLLVPKRKQGSNHVDVDRLIVHLVHLGDGRHDHRLDLLHLDLQVPELLVFVLLLKDQLLHEELLAGQLDRGMGPDVWNELREGELEPKDKILEDDERPDAPRRRPVDVPHVVEGEAHQSGVRHHRQHGENLEDGLPGANVFRPARQRAPEDLEQLQGVEAVLEVVAHEGHEGRRRERRGEQDNVAVLDRELQVVLHRAGQRVVRLEQRLELHHRHRRVLVLDQLVQLLGQPALRQVQGQQDLLGVADEERHHEDDGGVDGQRVHAGDAFAAASLDRQLDERDVVERRVRVDELEGEELARQRVDVVGVRAMVLQVGEPVRNFPVQVVENLDGDGVERRADVGRRALEEVVVGDQHVVAQEEDSTDHGDDTHDQERHDAVGVAQPREGLEPGVVQNLRSVHGALDHLPLEAGSVSFLLLEVVHAPEHGDLLLAPLPELQHDHTPHGEAHNEGGHEDRLGVDLDAHVDLRCHSEESRDQEPRIVVVQEAEVQRNLLAEVVLHRAEGLLAERRLPPLDPPLLDGANPAGVVHREVRDQAVLLVVVGVGQRELVQVQAAEARRVQKHVDDLQPHGGVERMRDVLVGHDHLVQEDLVQARLAIKRREERAVGVVLAQGLVLVHLNRMDLEAVLARGIRHPRLGHLPRLRRIHLESEVRDVGHRLQDRQRHMELDEERVAVLRPHHLQVQVVLSQLLEDFLRARQEVVEQLVLRLQVGVVLLLGAKREAVVIRVAIVVEPVHLDGRRAESLLAEAHEVHLACG